MPPKRRSGNPSLTPRQSVRRGLNVAGLPDEGLLAFEFKPSVGIAAAQIDKLGLDIRSFREPLKRVVQRVMAPSFRENFEAEGRPDEWPEPAPETLDIRERLGYSSDMSLDRSGLLKRTIQQLNVWTITEKNATIQSLPDKIKYGGIHQEGYAGSGGGRSMKQYIDAAGGDAKEAFRLQTNDLNTAMKTGQKAHGNVRNVSEIPQRQFVLIQEDDMDAIEEVFVEWLTERVARAGFRPGV